MKNLTDQLNKAKKNVQLSAGRKAAVKTALMDYMNQTPARRVAWFSFFYSRSFVIPAVCLIVILSGAATASASQVALPGDSLYPVKVSVVEKVQSAFARGDKAQAELALNQLEQRMDEGVVLAEQDSLSDQAEMQLDDLMTQHAEKFKENIQKLSDDSNVETAAELNAKYEAIINTHNKVLKHLSNDSKLNESLDEQSAEAAEVRAELEDKAAESQQPEVASQNKISAAQKVLSEVQNYIDSKESSSRVSDSGRAAADASMKSAQNLIDQAIVQQNNKNYKAVFDLANQAIRTAQEAKSELRLNYNLNVELNNSAGNSNNRKGGSGKGNQKPGNFQERVKEHWSNNLRLQFDD